MVDVHKLNRFGRLFADFAEIVLKRATDATPQWIAGGNIHLESSNLPGDRLVASTARLSTHHVDMSE